MMIYRILLLTKFLGVVLYSGGLIGSFVATSLADRKRAVHAVASPGLLVIWVSGYFLTLQLQVPVTELWTTGGLILSLISQLALVRSVTRDRRTPATFLTTFVPLFLVLVLMVFRPTWSDIHS